jgi:hypothetical protein
VDDTNSMQYFQHTQHFYCVKHAQRFVHFFTLCQVEIDYILQPECYQSPTSTCTSKTFSWKAAICNLGMLLMFT